MNNNLSNDYEVRLATLAAMEGDMTKVYANIYEVDKAILDKIDGHGGMGARIDDLNISTGTVWSSYKTDAEIANVSNNVYSRADMDTKLSYKADTSTVYDKTYIDSSLNTIKTILDASFNDISATLNLKADTSTVYTKTVINTMLQEKVKSYNVVEINALTTAEYEAISVKDPSTMYVITDVSL